jgi:hypothetical protein
MACVLGMMFLGCDGKSPAADGGGDSGIALSASDLAPGEFLTIRHGSLVAGSLVEVTFKGPGSYAVTVKTSLTGNGAARIPVPPFVDTTATTALGAFTAGNVKVSVTGIASEKPLRIKAVPALAPAVPGETLRTVIRVSLQSLEAAKQKIATAAAETGRSPQPLTSRIDEQISDLAAMDAELATGRLTVVRTGGPYVLQGRELELAESLIAASVFGAAAAVDAGTLRAAADGPISIEEPLLAIRNQGLPGAQAFGSYLSVIAGVAGVIIGGVPGAFVGGVAAIAITAVTSVATAGVAFVTELLLDAARGNDPSFYRAAERAEEIFVAGFRSTALTLLGIAEWPFSWMGWTSIANDLRDMMNSLRDLQCHAYDNQLVPASAVAPLATPEEFCDETRGPGCTSAFRCRDGSTICADRVCNRHADCADGSDESPRTDCSGGASCCIATQGCPAETATSCAQTCCCCPYGQVCDQGSWSHGCVGTAQAPLILKAAASKAFTPP